MMLLQDMSLSTSSDLFSLLLVSSQIISLLVCISSSLSCLFVKKTTKEGVIDSSGQDKSGNKALMTALQNRHKTRMWATNVMATLPNIGGALCSTP